MRIPIDPIRTDVEFGRDRSHDLAIVHALFASSANALLSDLASTDRPVRQGQVDGGDGLNAGGQLDHQVGEGHAGVGGDVARLTIQDVIQPAGAIDQHLGSANDAIDKGHNQLGGRTGHTRPPDIPPGGPIAIPRDLAGHVGRVTSSIPIVEGAALPWELINSAVTSGAAGEILRELGGPQRIQRIQDDVARLDQHVSVVEKESGPQGPQGPPGPQGAAGPQGPQGPHGQDGRDAQILI